MMQVDVKLHGILRRYRPTSSDGSLAHHPFFVVLPNGSTITSLLQHLKIPDGFVSAVAQNGSAAEETAVLQDGDKVALFPPSAGG